MAIEDKGPVGLAAGETFFRPSISVCMATYNCDRYIVEQITSILPQLSDQDEIIVVDDASSDRTVELLTALVDPRIKFTQHTNNEGVIPTFEDAVRSATKEIIFLSDGDDIWAHNKVERVLAGFPVNSNVQIVVTAIQVIDEDGHALDTKHYLKGREFSTNLLSNLLRNRFQGSAMAFRSSLLPKILPFPKTKIFLHDAWIGAFNQITGGETVFIDEPLLYYRRHSNNFSRRLRLRQQVMARGQLLWALAGRWLKLRLNPRSKK